MTGFRAAARAVMAILAGIVVLTITSFAIEAVADPLLMHLFPHALPTRAAVGQNPWSALFMFAYTALCVAVGGYVTAWIARRAPVLHGLAMGVVQDALTVWAMMALREQAPLRNWIVALVLTIPMACLGALLRARQTPLEALS